MAPGDPVESILGPQAKIEEIEALRAQLKLDRPIYLQFTHYLGDVAKFNMGESLHEKKPVIELIKERMPPTFLLALVSVTFAAIIGTFLGSMAAYQKKKFFDNFSRVFSLFALSFPIYSLAPLLVYIFAIKLKILPVSEWGELRHMILPIMTLTIPLSAVITRVSRNKFLEEKNGQWVTVLKAKGMDDWSINLRIVKVCLPTILNVVGIQLSVVLAGAMISETIFDIPGMGTLLFEGIQNRDYPLVQGIIIYSTVIYMLIYYLIDYLNEFVDPRIK